MRFCKYCKKNKQIDDFQKNNKTLVRCIDCRNKSKQWKDKNKERIKLYNKCYRNKELHKWEEIKNNNNITDNVKGKPSNHRVLHETENNVVGKKCCNCKKWNPLNSYNFSSQHFSNYPNVGY